MIETALNTELTAYFEDRGTDTTNAPRMGAPSNVPADIR